MPRDGQDRIKRITFKCTQKEKVYGRTGAGGARRRKSASGEQHEQNQEREISFGGGQTLDDTSTNMDLPIALRKETRGAGREPPDRYGFKHGISNYVSYEALSSSYKAFVASLQIAAIPKD